LKWYPTEAPQARVEVRAVSRGRDVEGLARAHAFFRVVGAEEAEHALDLAVKVGHHGVQVDKRCLSGRAPERLRRIRRRGGATNLPNKDGKGSSKITTAP